MAKRITALLLAVFLLGALCACDPNTDDFVFTGQELVNNEDYMIRISSVEMDEFQGYVATVQIENKTQFGLVCSVVNGALNGCMCDPHWEESVSAGELVISQIVFEAKDLQGYGIEEVSKIDLVIGITPEDDPEGTLLQEQFTVYPMSEAAAQVTKRPSAKTDIVISDNEYCKVTVTGKDPESFWGYDLYVYVENKTDKTLMLRAQGVGVNGIPCDPYWICTVLPGTCSNTTAYWFTDRLEAAGITQVDRIEMTLTVQDCENWTDGLLYSEQITLE